VNDLSVTSSLSCLSSAQAPEPPRTRAERLPAATGRVFVSTQGPFTRCSARIRRDVTEIW